MNADTTNPVPPLEKQALADFYAQTGGENWREQEGWRRADSPCDWHGVTCQNGHVTHLALPNNNLTGSLPPRMSLLTHLMRLDLSGNQLHGKLPDRIGNLNRLTHLDLSENELRGTIPARLGILAKLEILDLHSNHLNGEIPPGLGDLRRLTRLDLSSNALSGEVPPQLGHLVNLTKLNLAANQLSGPLPETLINLAALESFTFNDTELAEPSDTAFQAWLSRVPHVESTGVKAGVPITRVSVMPKRLLLAALAGVGMLGGVSVLVLLLALPLLGLGPSIALGLLGLAGTGFVVGKLALSPPRAAQALPGITYTQVTHQQVERELRALVGAIRGDVPDDVMARVEGIAQTILEILPKIEDINSSDQDVYVVRQTVRDYLPEALRNYRSLPSDYATQHIVRDGKTAHELLIEQLDIIDAEIKEIAARYPKQDAQRLAAHGRFLEDKFKEDEGLVPPELRIPPPPGAESEEKQDADEHG